MQKLFVFVVLSGFIFSCSNVEQHREAIELLSANWETTTQEVTNFSSEVTQEIAKWQGEINGMKLEEGVKEQLAEGIVVRLDSLKNVGQQQGQALQSIQQEVGSFMTAWEAETADVNALKSGLETGKLAPELIGMIDSLNLSISVADSMVEDWRTKLNETKTLYSNTSQTYLSLAKVTQ